MPGALNQERQRQDRGRNRQNSRNREDICKDSSMRSGEKGSDEKINQNTLMNSSNYLQQHRFPSDIGYCDVSLTEDLPVSSSVEELEQCDSNRVFSKVIINEEGFNKSRTVDHLTFDNSNNVTSNAQAKELQNVIHNSRKLQTEELRTASESDRLSLVLVEDGLSNHGEKVEQSKRWLTAESEKGLPASQNEDFSNQKTKVNKNLKVSSDNNFLKETVINSVELSNKNDVGFVGCHHNMAEESVPDSPEDTTSTNLSYKCATVGGSHETRLEFVITEQGEDTCGSCVRNEKELQVKTTEMVKPLNCILGERTNKTLLLAIERDQGLMNDILDDSIKEPLHTTKRDLDASVLEHKATTNATASVDKSDSFVEMKMHSCVSGESPQLSKDSDDVREFSLSVDSINNGCSRAVVSLRSAFEEMAVKDSEPSEEEHDTTIASQFSEGISETSHLSSSVLQTTEEFVKSKSDLEGLLSQPCGIVSASFGASLEVCSQIMEEPNNSLVGNSPPLSGTAIERPGQNVSSSRCKTEVLNGYGESKAKRVLVETEGEKHSSPEQQGENKDKNGQSVNVSTSKPSRKKTGKLEANKPSKVKTKSKEKAEKKKHKEKRSIKDSTSPLESSDKGIKKEILCAKRERSTQAKQKKEVSPQLISTDESKTTHAMCEPVCDGNKDDDDGSDDSNWEANFDDSGEYCINPELLAEVCQVRYLFQLDLEFKFL